MNFLKQPNLHFLKQPGLHFSKRPWLRYVAVLLWASCVSLGLYVYGSLRSPDFTYSYLPINLILAWVPLLLSVWLVRLLPTHAWLSFWPLVASFLWLGFLPNSFYMVSDYIHLREMSTADIVFNAVVFTSFIATALILGFSSLYLVHREFARRFNSFMAGGLIMFILLLCSFAIFLGRDLRWNTWDVLLNPAGLLFDVSDRFINPSAHPQTFLTTASFFVLLSTLYIVVWQAARYLKSTGSKIS